MSSSGTNPRALRELIRDAAQDREPELNWDRIEAKLFAELDDQADPLSGERPSIEPAARVEVVAATAATTETSFVAVETQQEVAAVAVLERPSLPPQDLVARPQAKPASKPSRWTRWVAPLAVAAALGAVWMSHGHRSSERQNAAVVAEPIDTNTVPLAPGMNGVRDLSALQAGDIVEAAVGPVEFGQAGSMQWTLSAGSRLTVLEGLQSGTHVVELESGSMRGSVAPGASIPLVISAGETEVVSLGAGAIFSVTRSSRRVVMHLEEGSASVGQRGHRAEGRIFMAPLVAAFSLDGGSSFELLPTEKVAVDDAPAPIQVARAADDDSMVDVLPAVELPANEPVRSHRSSTPAKEPTTASAASDKSSSKEPSDSSSKEPGAVNPKSEPRLSDAALSSTIVSCIERLRSERQAKAADGVRILVDSVLTVRVSDDGTAQGVVFNPPLESGLQSCAVIAYRTKLDAGARSVRVPVSLH